MEATVARPFTDRLDGRAHMPGEALDLPAARARELAAGGFVEIPAPRRAAPKSGRAAKRGGGAA